MPGIQCLRMRRQPGRLILLGYDRWRRHEFERDFGPYWSCEWYRDDCAEWYIAQRDRGCIYRIICCNRHARSRSIWHLGNWRHCRGSGDTFVTPPDPDALLYPSKHVLSCRPSWSTSKYTSLVQGWTYKALCLQSTRLLFRCIRQRRAV